MKNLRVFYLQNFGFLEVKFSIYLNRRVFVMFLSFSKMAKPFITFLTINYPFFFVKENPVIAQQ